MPPPRLPRPLRPHKPRWSLAQVRWASNQPRHQSQEAHGGDPTQASEAAPKAQNRGNSSIDKRPEKILG
jgi:hypothetical protein